MVSCVFSDGGIGLRWGSLPTSPVLHAVGRRTSLRHESALDGTAVNSTNRLNSEACGPALCCSALSAFANRNGVQKAGITKQPNSELVGQDS